MKLPAKFTVLCPDHDSAALLKQACIESGVPATELTVEPTNMLQPETTLELSDITYRTIVKEVMLENPYLYVHDMEDKMRNALEKFYNK